MTGRIILLLPLLFSFAAAAQPSEWQVQTIDAGVSSIQVSVRGAGQTIVMIPSLGRGASDFEEVANALVVAGYRVILPEPRGIGQSIGPLDDTTLHDWAGDVAAVIRNIGEPTVVVGHALGNRIARTLSSDHPELVDRVILLAAGGSVPIEPEIRAALLACFDETLSREEHLAAVKLAFFADGNDPEVWEDGWYSTVATAQIAANRLTPVEEWWSGGIAPIMVIQAQEDRIAVRENGEFLKQEFPDRVTLVNLSNAGHAMLPEQPESIAATIVNWLED